MYNIIYVNGTSYVNFFCLFSIQRQLLSFVTMAKVKENCEDMNISKPTISVAITMISIPLSMILWITNILFKKFYGDNMNELNGKYF